MQGVPMMAGEWLFQRADTILRWPCQRQVTRDGKKVKLNYDVIGCSVDEAASLTNAAVIPAGAMPEEVFAASPTDRGLWFPLACCLPLEHVVRCVHTQPQPSAAHNARTA